MFWACPWYYLYQSYQTNPLLSSHLIITAHPTHNTTLMLKRTLLTIACALPFIASAQSWHLIASGGAMWNSATSNPTPYEKSSTIGGTAGIGVSYQKNHLEYGLMLGYRHYSLQTEGDLMFEEDCNPATGYGTLTHVKFIVGMPALYAAPFVNYHFGSKKFDWYAGLSPAYLRFFS